MPHSRLAVGPDARRGPVGVALHVQHLPSRGGGARRRRGGGDGVDGAEDAAREGRRDTGARRGGGLRNDGAVGGVGGEEVVHAAEEEVDVEDVGPVETGGAQPCGRPGCRWSCVRHGRVALMCR